MTKGSSTKRHRAKSSRSRGSEVVRGWEKTDEGIWKLTLPHEFFGAYNPYQDLIVGDWFDDKARPHHTGEVYLEGHALGELHLLDQVIETPFTWYTESDQSHTYIYAHFGASDPNDQLVEINVRESCFYPDQPGRNYITVRGFRMRHAATQWPAPTAEQIGLIGTHWSKGWIIEENVISDSKCAGITLGKDRASGHNVWTQDPSRDGAIHYNEVIERALESGWSRESIGSHIVRQNTIYDCEQSGICGSLGAIFSEISENHIYRIHVKRQFSGAEMAGIKIHAAIDVTIQGNRVHHSWGGLWLDWMAQGARVTGNLFYDNSLYDLFVEVNHGPFLIDNNLFLSQCNLWDWSQGGAFVHNLFGGELLCRTEFSLYTPHHRPHSTLVVGKSNIKGGDHRFYNNIFVGDGTAGEKQREEKDPKISRGYGTWVYEPREFPVMAGGNVYYSGARPYGAESDACTLPEADPKPTVTEEGPQVYLSFAVDESLHRARTQVVTSETLGTTVVSGLPFENPDGSPISVDVDFFGKKRDRLPPLPGPFDHVEIGANRMKLA